VTLDYSFYVKQGEGEKYFNKTAPQELNGTTLAPDFNVAAGHQVPECCRFRWPASRWVTTGWKSR
jgi:hypothetical protein